MRIGFVFTNYNNSEYTRAVIESIYSNREADEARVVVVDNGSEKSDVAELKALNERFPMVSLILNPSNVGYFPGLNIGIDYLKKECPPIRYMVVGNNDLVFPENFIGLMRQHGAIFEKHAVVCPDLTTLGGIHQNPHVISDITWMREVIWDIYYSTYWVSVLIKRVAKTTRKVSERRDYQEWQTPRSIEQGYGACYILGPIFFERCERLWAPTFMMGEEFFLAHQLRAIGQKCYYDPVFRVTHCHHGAVDRVPERRVWKMAREAHRVYRRYVRSLPFSKKWEVLSDQGRER